MKKFELTYTEDVGQTFKTSVIEAENLTQAYVILTMDIPMSAAITDWKIIE